MAQTGLPSRGSATMALKVDGPGKRKSLPREEVRQAFRKEPNSDWEEECRCSDRRPWEEEWAVCTTKLCGRRCIASLGVSILDPCVFYRHYVAVQLCAKHIAWKRFGTPALPSSVGNPRGREDIRVCCIAAEGGRAATYRCQIRAQSRNPGALAGDHRRRWPAFSEPARPAPGPCCHDPSGHSPKAQSSMKISAGVSSSIRSRWMKVAASQPSITR